MVLERGDPLRRVLRCARRFDDALVIVPRSAGKRHALARLLGLLLLFGLASASRVPAAIVDRVDATLHEVASIVRQSRAVVRLSPI